MFSEGINSSVYCWRSNSARMAAPTSGSTMSIRLVRSVRACSIPPIIAESLDDEVGLRNRTLAQNRRRRASQVKNGRGLSDPARPSVEHEIKLVAQAGDD